jgi:hypothetical protein
MVHVPLVYSLLLSCLCHLSVSSRHPATGQRQPPARTRWGERSLSCRVPKLATSCPSCHPPTTTRPKLTQGDKEVHWCGAGCSPTGCQVGQGNNCPRGPIPQSELQHTTSSDLRACSVHQPRVHTCWGRERGEGGRGRAWRGREQAAVTRCGSDVKGSAVRRPSGADGAGRAPAEPPTSDTKRVLCCNQEHWGVQAGLQVERGREAGGCLYALGRAL